MEENAAERRRHKRHWLGAELASAYLIESRGRHLGQERCLLQDLSHCGMCIQTPRRLESDRDYFFWLEFSETELGSAAVKGRVRWSRKRGDRGYDAGVSFTQTSRAWLAPYDPFRAPPPEASLP